MVRNAMVLLTINIIFYAFLDLQCIPVMVVAVLWSYYVGIKIRTSERNAKAWMSAGIVSMVLILVFFKYCNFFIEKGNGTFNILMPLGISYYTFKIISYLVDIYQKKIDRKINLLSYAIYVSFFPQIICGPISRAEEVFSWLEEGRVTAEKFTCGIGLILSGIFKKFVIADRLSPYVTIIFDNPDVYPTIARWMAAFFFSIQLYCDFAGYSEIAVGVCNLLGFQCRMNFDKPYFAADIREFWKRWHISLSTWLRDYVYIPLGGNRGGLEKI